MSKHDIAPNPKGKADQPAKKPSKPGKTVKPSKPSKPSKPGNSHKVKPAGESKTAGKPIKFDLKLSHEICELLAEGVPLREICRMDRMPGWWNAYEWMKVNDDFAHRVARAREIGFDAIAQQSLDIVDEVPPRAPGGGFDNAAISHQKLRAEHRLKLLAKWSPKRYGDKVETTLVGPDGGPINTSLKIEFVNSAD